MTQKEKLIYIIQHKGDCDIVSCFNVGEVTNDNDCVFAGKKRGCHPNRYKRTLALFVEKYGKDELLEILL